MPSAPVSPPVRPCAPAGPPASSSESSDWSQAAGRGAAGIDAGAGPGSIVPDASADMTSATTCLQLYATGQLHSPSLNRAGCPSARVRNADVW